MVRTCPGACSTHICQQYGSPVSNRVPRTEVFLKISSLLSPPFEISYLFEEPTLIQRLMAFIVKIHACVFDLV